MPKIEVINTPAVNVMLPDGINLRIDPVAQVMYVKIRDAEIVKTKEEKEGLILDFDASGNLVGFSIINPKKVSLTRRKVIRRLAKRFHVPALQRLRPSHAARQYEYA